MSEREISWGDEEEEEFVPAVVVKAPVVEQKREKAAPLPVPEWSVDTRADLPIYEALGSKAAGAPSAPAWPEESEPSQGSNSETNSYANLYNNNNSYNNNTSPTSPHWDHQQPLERRPGRGNSRGTDQAPRESREFREPRESREPRDSREPREPRDPREPRGNGRNRYDDLSSLNLPGVDLSKMPEATTRLSFSNDRPPRRDDRFPRESVQAEENNGDVHDRVNRVTREMEELAWGEPEPEPMSVRVSAPVSIRVSEPVKQQGSTPSAAVKVVNSNSRLEDDGWGDEPEEPVRISEPVRIVEPEPVKNVETVVVKSIEPVVVNKPVTVEPVVNKSVEPLISKPEPFNAQSAPLNAQSAPLNAQSAPLNAQSAPFNAPHSPHHHQMPFMMPQQYMMNSMSPVGQMPISAPMSYMPGMMMPIWVTCPFCYHCYMYPPIAPGSGPAPGAANPILNLQQ